MCLYDKHVPHYPQIIHISFRITFKCVSLALSYNTILSSCLFVYPVSVSFALRKFSSDQQIYVEKYCTLNIESLSQTKFY